MKAAGEANTVIRVETKRSKTAVVRTAPLPRPRPGLPTMDDMPVVAEAETVVDTLTTGSTAATVVPLRVGLGG